MSPSTPEQLISIEANNCPILLPISTKTYSVANNERKIQLLENNRIIPCVMNYLTYVISYIHQIVTVIGFICGPET